MPPCLQVRPGRARPRPWAPPALALPLAGCAHGVLDPAGPIGAGERLIMLNSLAIMLAIVVPTILLALGTAWWFRAGNVRARRRPHWVYSGRVELLVWSIPLLAILFLGGVIWIGSHALDPYRPIDAPTPPLEVQVVSMDWKWLFIYPQQGIAAVNQLVVPAGVPVHFSLTSASVMNAFFVPRLGGMIATMNGMRTQLHLQADQPGDYDGMSTQFSGDGFSDMHFVLHAVPAARFEQWVGQARNSGRALDRAAYQALNDKSANVPPATWRAVEPGLFEAVLKQSMSPQPGPQQGPRQSLHQGPHQGPHEGPHQGHGGVAVNPRPGE